MVSLDIEYLTANMSTKHDIPICEITSMSINIAELFTCQVEVYRISWDIFSVKNADLAMEASRVEMFKIKPKALTALKALHILEYKQHLLRGEYAHLARTSTLKCINDIPETLRLLTDYIREFILTALGSRVLACIPHGNNDGRGGYPGILKCRKMVRDYVFSVPSELFANIILQSDLRVPYDYPSTLQMMQYLYSDILSYRLIAISKLLNLWHGAGGLLVDHADGAWRATAVLTDSELSQLSNLNHRQLERGLSRELTGL